MERRTDRKSVSASFGRVGAQDAALHETAALPAQVAQEKADEAVAGGDPPSAGEASAAAAGERALLAEQRALAAATARQYKRVLEY